MKTSTFTIDRNSLTPFADIIGKMAMTTLYDGTTVTGKVSTAYGMSGGYPALVLENGSWVRLDETITIIESLV